MLKFYFVLFVHVLLTLLFISCQDPKEYRVHSDFSEYLLRFQKIANSKGVDLQIKERGIVVEFANLKTGIAGLTHFENPIRIEIDKKYWDAISKSSDADLRKENLMFHEFGHGLLNRKHINSTLENGDWKSIMCGGDKVNNRPWNINYRGFRRTYYINELFDESTPVTDSLTRKLNIDTTKYVLKYHYDFNIIGANGFPIVDNAQYKSSIDLSTGRLCLLSKIAQNFLFLIKTTVDVQSDFAYELSLDYRLNDNDQYGLVFGTMPDANSNTAQSLEYFTINNKGEMWMGNKTCYSFFTQLTLSSLVSQTSKNTLKVYKQNNMLYYFVNNTYCYCSEIEVQNSGFRFGFNVPPNGTVYVDDFKIFSADFKVPINKVIQNSPIDYKIVTDKDVNNYICK